MICAILIAGVLTGLYLLSKVKTAILGNIISSICVAIAIILTLYYHKIITYKLLWISIVIGTVIGILWILRIK